MAGEPKPCVMREKWVRLRWMLGSRICWGRVLQSGDRSWFSRSISSFVMTLERARQRMIKWSWRPALMWLSLGSLIAFELQNRGR